MKKPALKNKQCRKINIYCYRTLKWINIRWFKIKRWKYWEVFLVLFSIISLILIIVFFESLSVKLFPSENSRGELIKVILTVFGGIGVIYGLWINSQRIKAQNIQNKLVEDRNIDQKSYDADKRFGEAIGYLGSENTSIVLGGIYALNQLAKEDKRYKPIVAGLFTSYLQGHSHKLYDEIEQNNSSQTSSKPRIPVIVKTLTDLLFSSDFESIALNFSNTKFKNIGFSTDINNCNFDSCEFIDCIFRANITNCVFSKSRIEQQSYIGRKNTSLIENCLFTQTIIYDSRFFAKRMFKVDFEASKLNEVIIESSEIIECDFSTVKSDSKIKFIRVNSFKGTWIYKDDEMYKFYMCNTDDSAGY